MLVNQPAQDPASGSRIDSEVTSSDGENGGGTNAIAANETEQEDEGRGTTTRNIEGAPLEGNGDQDYDKWLTRMMRATATSSTTGDPDSRLFHLHRPTQQTGADRPHQLGGLRRMGRRRGSRYPNPPP
ncbi:hypothetical protein QAD02_010530 [Eretmocerus hayati]|uniref:Uncharacterized protein n=1 Tax=Eretmocerus hayati TaxID=131215 RepID=A0ACC2NUH7_9HYME|nr:hypothetical protein QAD02_010530 [Eretmocerus hayati]